MVGVVPSEAHAWNIACDAEINDDLRDAHLPLPGKPVLPEVFDWPRQQLAEVYFSRTSGRSAPEGSIPRSAVSLAGVDRTISNPDCGSGVDGRGRLWDLDDTEVHRLSTSEAMQVRQRVARDIVDQAREQGPLPRSILRWAEKTLGSTVDWRNVLAAEVRRGLLHTTGCIDYSFLRRARRASAIVDAVLPGTFRPIPELAIVVDTSGSMGADAPRVRT